MMRSTPLRLCFCKICRRLMVCMKGDDFLELQFVTEHDLISFLKILVIIPFGGLRLAPMK